MASTFGLLFQLIGVCYGMNTSCDGRQDGAQCLQTWGETVFIQLMDTASTTSRFEWNKKGIIILRWRNNTLVTNTIKNRSEFIATNGTFRISRLRKSDSSKYNLKLFNSKGELIGNRTLHLCIEGQPPQRVGAILALVLSSILVFVYVTVTCVQRRTQKRKEEKRNDDLIYADVTVVQRERRKSVVQDVKEEVEYSQIKTAG